MAAGVRPASAGSLGQPFTWIPAPQLYRDNEQRNYFRCSAEFWIATLLSAATALASQSLTSRCRGNNYLFCALVDPGADEGDLVFGQGFAFVFGRHVQVFVEDSRDAVDKRAFFAFAGLKNRSVFAALLDGSQAVNAELGFLFFGAVTFEAAGFFKDRPNVSVVRDAGLCRGGRKLLEIRFCRVARDRGRKGDPQQN